jgi:uncharacterized protein
MIIRSDTKRVRLSASDLSNHLACNHLTALDLDVAAGLRSAPKWNSPDAWVLQQRGIEHENAYIRHLESQDLTVLNLRDTSDEVTAFASTCAAVREGTDVIVQAVLAKGEWFGRADVLRKVAVPSKLGDWSYEAYDCKLAVETKGATILQLALYSELLEEIQGEWPNLMHVVTPNDGFNPESYRVLDFTAYYRYVKRRLQGAVENGYDSYPEPNEHCSVCRWWSECDDQRRQDDHLSLVAGITSLQRKQLNAWDVTTVNSLSILPLPLERRPDRGSKDGYVRVREQARVQVAGRVQRIPVYEVLEINPEHGFYGLPEPSPGDVFFDLEGDPFVGRGGREYLFGFASNDDTSYQHRWAITAEEEKLAFEWFVDWVIVQWKRFPAMHIYHFTGYETGALKRLMGRYATREAEIDQMLRAHLFVDLHAIVKRTVRASVEQYSLKALEVFHAFERKLTLDFARDAMRRMQHSLEMGEVEELDQSIRDKIVLYNADDCLSTRSLQTWLEQLRKSSQEVGNVLPRPVLLDGRLPEDIDERQQRTADLVARLQTGVPDDSTNRDEEQAARWLLSNLMDWHRRESKAEWWEFYRLGELSDEDLLGEKSALSGLRYTTRVGIQRNVPTDRYSFERQESDVHSGDVLCARGEKIGEAANVDDLARTIDIRKTKRTAEIHPSAVYVKDIGPNTGILASALHRIGAWVDANGIDQPGSYRAARDLLLARPPRLRDGTTTLVLPGERTVTAAKRLATMLDHSLLAIQGPPGAGKTYTGARMICELVRQGKRVGITATSHKVIAHLLNEAILAAEEAGIAIKCVQKIREEDKPDQDSSNLQTTVSNEDNLPRRVGTAAN